MRENLIVARARPRPARRSGPSRRCSTCSRGCEERREPAREPALRRRAADAGHRPRADGQPARAADGRAVRRPGAADRRRRRAHDRRLKGEGLSIVLVEQNIKLTLELADDIAILNSGRVVFTGRRQRDQDQRRHRGAAPGGALRDLSSRIGGSEFRAGRRQAHSRSSGLASALARSGRYDRWSRGGHRGAVEQVRADGGAQAWEAGARDAAQKHHHRCALARRRAAGGRVREAASRSAIACRSWRFANAETKALNQKQEADIVRAREPGAAARRSRRHGPRHAGDQAAAAAVLLRGAARYRREGGADRQRRHRRVRRPQARPPQRLRHACRCRTATRPPRSWSAASPSSASRACRC